jgi:PAS domain-containing protein
MRDRIASLGGSLRVESAPGKGTRVVGSVPLRLAQLTPDVEMLLQRTTDALQDCFGLYRAMRDASGAVVDFVVEHLNDAACRDSGRPREQQLGRTLGSLEPGYLRSERFAWHRRALEAEGPTTLEDVQYERSERGRRLSKAYEVRAAPLGGGRLALTWRDITDRKHMEEELLLSEQRVSSAVQSAPLALYTMDSDLRYTWVFNGQAGFAGDETVLGRSDEELFGHAVAAPLTRVNRRALRGERVRTQVDVDLPRGRATFDISVEPLRDDDGRITGIAGAAYDITDAETAPLSLVGRLRRGAK